MSYFNLKNLSISLAIAGLAALLVYSLVGKPPSNINDNTATLAAVTIKHFPGDERTGILDREVHFDADGLKTKEHIRFKDGTDDAIHYNLRGHIQKVVETDPKGDYKVFNFNSAKGQPPIQAFRKDQTLRQETRSVGEKKLREVKHYAEDGKTLLAVQLEEQDVSQTITLYHKDGKTAKTVYQSFQKEERVELKTYSDKGALKNEETILPPGSKDPNDPEDADVEEEYPGQWGETILVSGYKDDGKTLWFYVKQYSYQPPDAESPPVKEYGADGKLLRAFHNVASPEDQGPDGLFLSIDIYDDSGKLTSRRHLRSDYSVVRDETLGANDQVIKRTKYKPAELVDKEAEALMKRCYSEDDTAGLEPYFDFSVEPNYLRWALEAASQE